MKLILLIILLIFALCDMKSGGVPRLFVLFGLAGAFLIRMFWIDSRWVPLIVGLIPALILFLIGILTKETIGYADAATFAIVGMLLGISEVLKLMTFSMVMNAVAGGILLLCRKKKLKDKMVFLPSVFFAFLLGLLTG